MFVRLTFALLLLIAAAACPASAQMPNGWKAHDLKRPAPPVVEPGESNLPLAAPGDAIVLFDGSDLSKWRAADGSDAKWKVVDGAMESVPGSGYLFTREEFGDCQLHIEWASPARVTGNSQGRGNSGVYFMGSFEVQVLDSFNNPTYADGSAGSVYGQHPPLANVCREPGQWQSYDIIFNRPRFDGEELVSPAYVTVLHNGVVIQNHSEYFGPSQWIQYAKYEPRPEKQSLALQDHGNPVRFRNIWIRPLADRPAAPSRQPDAEPEFEMDDETAQKLVGTYRLIPEMRDESKPAANQNEETCRIRMDDGNLLLKYLHVEFELQPVSKHEFAFRRSAGSLRFSTTDDGEIEAINVFLDARGKDAIFLPEDAE